MTDTISELVEDCCRYWREVDLPRRMVEDMGRELEAHLREAEAEGRDPSEVVGGDIAAFAADWAAASRGGRPVESWDAVQSRLTARPENRLFWWTTIAAVIVVVAVAVVTSGEEPSVDNEVWRWIWTIFAGVMTIGEIFTAGFFLLPFGIGGTFAAVAAWADLGAGVQWTAFFGGTAASMLYLRRFMRLQDTDDGLQIGPVRYVGSRAIVLEEIDTTANTGRIRVEAEEWRAITDGDAIAEGAEVEVVELRGTRLVVAEVK